MLAKPLSDDLQKSVII